MKLSRLKKNSSVSSTLPSNEKDSDDDDWVSVDDGSSKSSIIVSNKKESTVDKNNDILSQSESKFKRLKKSISQSSTKDDENSDGDIDWNDQIDVVSTQSSSISKNPTTSQNGTRATNNTPPRAKNNHAIQSPSHPSSTLKRKRLAKCKEKSTSSDSDSDSDIDWNDVSKVNSPCPSIDFSSASIRKVDSLVPGESSSSSSNSSSSSSSGTSHSILVQDIRDRLLQSVEKKRSFIDSLRPLSLLFTAHDVTSFQKQYINVSGNVINADELLIEACKKGAVKTAQLILSLTKSVNSERSVQSTKAFFASGPDITTTSTNQKIFAVNFREENNYVCLAINSLKNVTDLSAAKDIIRRHRLDMKKFGEERFNDEILFEPIKLAFQHSHYNLITLLCARSPLYMVLFLQSKVLLPAMNNKNTSTTNNASPEVNDNEATVGVDVVPEGDTVGGDDKDHMFVDEPARYPCVMFQLIQGDWSLGLSQALRSIDEQLCALTTQPSKSNQHGRAYELRTEMIRKLIRSTDSSDGSMIVHWAAEENLSVCLSRLLELDPTLITATDRQGIVLRFSTFILTMMI